MKTKNNISAIITGGANGLGFEFCKSLASDGYNIVIIDINEKNIIETSSFINNNFDVKCEGLVADVTDYDNCLVCYQKIIEKFPNPLVLVNNAGIMQHEINETEKLPIDHFEEMINVHVKGAMIWNKISLPLMKKFKFGRIINISSFMGLVGSPHRLNYVTAKAALIGLTRSLAVETARYGITVNAVAPGFVLTNTLKKRAKSGLLDAETIANRTPVGRWANPIEVSRVISFLVKKESSYITGIVLPIDGGISIGLDLGENIGTINESFLNQRKEIMDCEL